MDTNNPSSVKPYLVNSIKQLLFVVKIVQMELHCAVMSIRQDADTHFVVINIGFLEDVLAEVQNFWPVWTGYTFRGIQDKHQVNQGEPAAWNGCNFKVTIKRDCVKVTLTTSTPGQTGSRANNSRIYGSLGMQKESCTYTTQFITWEMQTYLATQTYTEKCRHRNWNYLRRTDRLTILKSWKNDKVVLSTLLKANVSSLIITYKWISSSVNIKTNPQSNKGGVESEKLKEIWTPE